MTIFTPCYCSREDVKRAPDFQSTAYDNVQIDRVIQNVARNIEGHLHRTFYPNDTTKYFDWPAQSGQGGGFITYPWKIYFDGNDCVTLTELQSPPGTDIDIAYVNLEPANYGPPYTYLELQRDKNAAFGGAATPQRAIVATGTWGYTADNDVVTSLAVAVSSDTATTIQVANAASTGVGDLLIVDSERMLVQEAAAVTTGDSQQNSGCSTAASNDNVLTLTSGSSVNLNEVILLDAEKMLVLDITGNNVTVKRQYDGTVLATHSSATVYAYRTLTVARGQLGTSAATHLISASVSKHRVPSLIQSLAIAESVNTILQETGGYSSPQGETGAQISGLGTALADLWDEAVTTFGRKSRMRTV